MFAGMLSDIPRIQAQVAHLYPSISSFEKCDGLILMVSEEYETEAIAGIRRWFSKTSRSIYHLGPLLPALNNPEVSEKEKSISVNGPEISRFMDSLLESHGPQSMVYVCAYFQSNFAF